MTEVMLWFIATLVIDGCVRLTPLLCDGGYAIFVVNLIVRVAYASPNLCDGGYAIFHCYFSSGSSICLTPRVWRRRLCH